MINAKFMRDHFTLVTITDNPAPQVHPLDPEDLREILAAITSGAARLRGVRCEFSDNRAAGELIRAAALITEALERIES
jgi:hypothetical protein